MHLLNKFLLLIIISLNAIVFASDYCQDKSLEIKTEKIYNFDFSNLAGCIPEDVKEILKFFKENGDSFKKVDEMPCGFLIVGPSGTGKTSIARAIAGELKCSFLSADVSGLRDEWAGPEKINEIFIRAKELAKQDSTGKSIIFFDEIDKIDKEQIKTLNALQTQVRFNKDNSIIVLAATNELKNLCNSLKPPRTFERIVKIEMPNTNARKAIIEHYSTKIKHDNNVDFDKLALNTEGFNPAQLKNLVFEAAIIAARENAKSVEEKHFDLALKIS